MISIGGQAGEEGIHCVPVAGVDGDRLDGAADTARRCGQAGGIPPGDDHLRTAHRHRPGDRLSDP